MIDQTAFLQSSYPAPVNELLAELGPQPLDPGKPRAALAQRISALQPADVVGDIALVDEEAARCCIAGLWLAANDLDTSHTVSQSCPGQSGSYWHGIMHRREPDYSNSAYWFRKTGAHPIFKQLPQAVAARVAGASDAAQALGRRWDPFAFNDLCQANLHDGDERALCQDLQLIEWCLLFDFCFQAAAQ